MLAMQSHPQSFTPDYDDWEPPDELKSTNASIIETLAPGCSETEVTGH